MRQVNSTVLSILIACVLTTGCTPILKPDTPKPAHDLSANQATKPLHIKENHVRPRPLRYGPLLAEAQMYAPAAPLADGILPKRITIPVIKLDALVEPVGVLENGQMDVPKNFDRVGILSPWTKPGMMGNAVIAGHFDHYTGPAVFYHIRKLKPGDQIFVSDEHHKKLTFRVKKVESYLASQAPIDTIFGDTQQAQLNLITSQGYSIERRKSTRNASLSFLSLLLTLNSIIKRPSIRSCFHPEYWVSLIRS